MATATRSETIDELPDVLDPGLRLDSDDSIVPPAGDALYEVVDGTVVELPPMGSQEIDIANLLAEAITLHAVPRGIGRAFVEPLFRLEKQSKHRRRPDVAFVTSARWPMGKRVSEGNAWELAPDLAIEVVSHTDLAGALNFKIVEYFGASISAVWVVYPATQQVYVYSSPTDVRILTPPAELDGGTILPGFRLPLIRLFEDDPSPTES